MKKIIIVAFFLLLVPFVSVRAITLKVVDGSFIDRYLGSMILEDNIFQSRIWYLDPSLKQRYSVNDVADVKLLTEKFGQKTKTSVLNKIPKTGGQKNIDYNIAKKYSGQFLIDTSQNNEVWYVNPLVLVRYRISIDEAGLKTLTNLAIGLPLDKLSIISIADFKQTPTPKSAINFQQYQDIIDVLKNSYFQPNKINDKDLFYGSLAGLASGLNDPYTEFFSPEGKQQFDDSIDNAVEGIGATVELKNNIFTIVAPLTGSPALKAGLLPNDQVLEVNHESIRGFTLKKSISLIKGPKGTTVTLKIYRQSENKTFEVTITRDRVEIPNVVAKQLDNNIVYFGINVFSPDMVSDFNNLRKQFVTTSSRGIIIDLRNNPGGYTDSAIKLADIWLPANVLILQEKTRDHTENYYTRTDESLKIPTIILTNSGTASASEIFSAALKEANLAKLVGQTTYGKGTGQMVSDFPDGSALKYTYFEWLTGMGNSVQNRGLKPDYEVLNDNIYNIDQQLNKAIELLK